MDQTSRAEGSTEPTESSQSTEARGLGEPPAARDGADDDTGAQREAAASQVRPAAELRLAVEGELPEDAPLRDAERHTAGTAWTASGSVG